MSKKSVDDRGNISTGSRVSRRSFVAATGAAGIGLAGCIGLSGSGSNNPYQGERLRVTAWSGKHADRFEKHVAKPFEEETGATVEVIPGWAEIISKIKSAPADDPPYDVTITDGYYYNQGRSEDLFLEVRKENVPNLEKVWDYLREFRTTEYGVPVDGEPLNIVYRNDLDTDFEEYSDLTDAERLTLEGGFYIYPAQVGAIIADEKPSTDELYDESTHEAPFDALRDLEVDIWYESGADLWQYFQQGTIDVAQGYGLSTPIQEKEARDLDITITVPEDNGGYYDHFCVVRGTDKRDLGEEFLNFILRADIQTEWNKTNMTVMSNRDVEYEGRTAEEMPTTAEALEKFNLPDWEYLSGYPEFYDKFKQLKSE